MFLYIQGIIEATKFGHRCMQPRKPKDMSEDCLFLNVYAQQSNFNSSNSSKLKPVLFWIHGGALLDGSSNDANGTALATHDVVVVAINYRLGIFGFLYGGTKDSPGNLGLYDQLEALKWVLFIQEPD